MVINKKFKNKIFLLGNQKNIYPFLLDSLFFVLTSKWEDPGFVIIESMFSKKLVLSSDCESGPKEIIKDNLNGFLYKNEDRTDFKKKFDQIYNLSCKNSKMKNEILLSALKTSKLYTLFNHYKDISNHLV